MSNTTSGENHSWLKGASTKSEEVEVYYDDWAEKYDRELAEWDYKAPDEAAKILQIHVNKVAKILDAGCGTGLTGNALKNAGFTHITGIDISAKSLPVAERTGAYIKIRQQDLQQHPFPFETDEFDAINCVGVLTYIEDPHKLFEEYCRVVRSGGYVLFTHRDDLYKEYNYPQILKSMEDNGLWKNILTSEPMPYLPKNKDFEDISVIYFLYQVI